MIFLTKRLLLSCIAGFFTSLMLVLLLMYPTALAFYPLVGALCLGLTFLFFWTHGSSLRSLMSRMYVLLLVFICAVVVLFSLLEWAVFVWLMIIGCGVVIGLFFFRELRPAVALTAHVDKAFRRALMMLWVFNAYALATGVFAFNLFFPNVSFVYFDLLGSMMFGGVSIMILRLYFDVPFSRLILWGLLVVLLALEVMWVIHLFPFGYFASAFFVTWLWYLVQLFVRFHISTHGILWKRQRWFLIENVALLILFFVLIRWI